MSELATVHPLRGADQRTSALTATEDRIVAEVRHRFDTGEPCTVGDLAVALDLRPALVDEVCRHLKRLGRVGLRL